MKDYLSLSLINEYKKTRGSFLALIQRDFDMRINKRTGRLPLLNTNDLAVEDKYLTYNDLSLLCLSEPSKILLAIIINLIGGKDELSIGGENIKSRIEDKLLIFFESIKDNGIIQVLPLMRFLFIAIYCGFYGKFKADIDYYLVHLLKSFELTGVICKSYNQLFKPESKDQMNIIYAYLGLNLMLLYAETDNLKYLNSSLKAHDKICSSFEKPLTLEGNIVLLLGLNKENEAIKKLYQN